MLRGEAVRPFKSQDEKAGDKSRGNPGYDVLNNHNLSGNCGWNYFAKPHLEGSAFWMPRIL